MLRQPQDTRECDTGRCKVHTYICLPILGVTFIRWFFCLQREPVLSVQVADRPLASLAFAPGAAPRLAGVGCTGGTVTVMQLSEGLVEQQENEKTVISAVGVWSNGLGLRESGRLHRQPPGLLKSFFVLVSIVPAVVRRKLHPGCLPLALSCRCWSGSRAVRRIWRRAPRRPGQRRARRRPGRRSRWMRSRRRSWRRWVGIVDAPRKGQCVEQRPPGLAAERLR